jgi:hypothetical protein
LDADNGKLHVLKAKMAVPDDDTPANQVITSPINRTIDWSDDEFGYTLLKPVNDPIETKDPNDADVTMAVYPDGYEIQSTGLPDDIEKSRLTQFNSITLSTLLDRAIAHFKERLEEIDEDYDRQIKTFIEEKDAKARAILAGLAQDLAECEWELPIEFCLGITPDDCRDPDPDGDGGDGGGDGGGGGDPQPTPWPTPTDTPRFPTPHGIPTPTPVPVPSPSPTPTPIGLTPADPPYDPSPSPVPTPSPSPTPTTRAVYSAAFTWQGNIDLPENMAVAFRYRSGAFRTQSSAYFVGPNSTSTGEGLIILPYIGGNAISPKTFAAIQSYDPHDLNAIEQAYKEGGYEGKTTIVVGGDAPVNRIYVQVLAREDLLEEDPGMPVLLDIFVIYDPTDPPPGVPVSTTLLLNTGGAPGPSPEPTDPTVTAVTPPLAPEGFVQPINIIGSNFQDGATVQVLGNTTVNVTGVTVVSDTQIDCDIFVNADPGFPAPNPYDVLIINPDGGNGIGIAVITSAV